MSQLFQIAGAMMILAAFCFAQLRGLDQRSYAYLVLNLIGSAILAVLAFQGRQWGFVLLEGVWAIVSFGSVLSRLRERNQPMIRERP
jgi:hypothetical protein